MPPLFAVAAGPRGPGPRGPGGKRICKELKKGRTEIEVGRNFEAQATREGAEKKRSIIKVVRSVPFFF